MITTNIATAYYRWLWYASCADRREQSYNLLIKDLHRKPFRWFVPNDHNRAYEGKNLRDIFSEQEDIPYEDVCDSVGDEVSMLELILALAFRCESILDGGADVPADEIFWGLLTNIGLDMFTDDEYHRRGSTEMVNQILDRIIDRKYHRSGRGGLFPLKFSKKDQRKVELWYQMSAYLVENYYTEGLYL